MGEDNLLYGQPTIYLGNQLIEPKPINGSELKIDPAEEGGDHTSASVWNRETGTIEYTITCSIHDENNPVGRWYQRMLRRFNAQRKALFWAVTHGYTMRIPCKTDDDEDGYMELSRPSQLRFVLRHLRFIPQFKIFDRLMYPCEIRKGRVRYSRVWPLPKDVLESYERQLLKYKIEKGEEFV